MGVLNRNIFFMIFPLFIPYDIKFIIFYFIKSSFANTIIRSWKRYLFYKKFIIDSIYNLPKTYSFIDYDLIYSVISNRTYFFFYKLYKLTTGYESYFSTIFNLFYILAVSIDDYEWISGNHNYYYTYNKFICLSMAFKFKWYSIIKLLE